MCILLAFARILELAPIKMGLFDIFKRKKVDSNLSGSTLFYHEDDFCQIELSPVENLGLFQAESDEINDLASKDAGTTGFTEIYVRNDNDRLADWAI
jgi:hypothetical protein